MKIYLDLILLLNFFFDFILLLSVSIILKRNVSLFNIILGSFIGSLSFFTLFLDINSIELFIIKVIISIIMIVISFGYCNIKYTIKNLTFLYTVSMFLGGILYYLNSAFSYKRIGMVFYHDGMSINIIFLIIFTPIAIYIYIKEQQLLKLNYNNYYKVIIKIDKRMIRCSGYLDTGNKLIDPYTFKPIILYYSPNKKMFYNHKYVYVPYHTIDGNNMIKCYKVDSIVIEGIGVRKNFLLGLLNEKINIDGIDCILNSKLLEE